MFSDPHTILAQLPIMSGSSVADLGSGTGAYTLAAATMVGPTGKVYACDVQKDMLVRLQNEARDRGLSMVQTIHSNIEAKMGTKLRDQSIDWVIVANVLFQSEDREGLATEIARILKPDGSVLLVDWTESFGNLGPHIKDIIPEQEAVTLFANHGLHQSPKIIDAGAHHYGILLKKTL